MQPLYGTRSSDRSVGRGVLTVLAVVLVIVLLTGGLGWLGPLGVVVGLLLAAALTWPLWGLSLPLLRQAQRTGRARFWLPGLLLLAAALSVGGWMTFQSYSVFADHAPLTGPVRYVVLMVVEGGGLEPVFASWRGKALDETRLRHRFEEAFPHLSRTFLEQGAYTLQGVTVWPSARVPAQTSLLTGSFPARTAIPALRYFDGEALRYTSFTGLGFTRHNNDLSPKVKTLFEYFPHSRSVSIGVLAHRGCSLSLPGPRRDEGVVAEAEKLVSAWGRFRSRDIPRVLVLALPTLDQRARTQALTEGEVVAACRNIDRLFGELLELYERKGIADQTLFVLTATHGVDRAERHLSLEQMLRDLRFEVYAPWRWRWEASWGPWESNFLKGCRGRLRRHYNALALWGGAGEGRIYVKGQKRDGLGRVTEEGWHVPPTEENLHHYFVGGVNVDLIRELLFRSPGIGLVLTAPEADTFNVYSLAGQGQIHRRVTATGLTLYRYQVVQGQDPLGYKPNPNLGPLIESGAWLTDRQWLEWTCRLPYPDALHRIANSFGSPRSGHLQLVAAEGWDFTPSEASDRLLTGSYGSLNRFHSVVPILFYGPGVQRTELPTGRTVDVLPTILKLCRVDYDPEDLDGEPLAVGDWEMAGELKGTKGT